MMRTLTIEWKHFDSEGQTCRRCGDTGETLRTTVRELNRKCRSNGVRFRIKETKLPSDRLSESNAILIEGRPLESLVSGLAVSETQCGSCSELLGRATECRAVTAGDETYESIPAEVIRAAACRAAGCDWSEWEDCRLSATRSERTESGWSR